MAHLPEEVTVALGVIAFNQAFASLSLSWNLNGTNMPMLLWKSVINSAYLKFGKILNLNYRN